MARVLAISSQVARGHVGLAAMVPALQALGHDVTALPTILLSNHPGHPHAAGERIAPSLLDRMLDAVAANGWLAEIDAVLTGYCPTAEHAASAAGAIRRVREASPHALVLVDAVLGDEPKGLYIAQEAAVAIHDQLLPLADIVKGNAFEAAWLANCHATDEPALFSAVAGQGLLPAASAATARALGVPTFVVTSVRDEAVGRKPRLVNILSTSTGANSEFPVAERAGVPKGTGDLLAALLAGHLLREPERGSEGAVRRALARAVEDVEGAVVGSVDKHELDLVAALPAMAARRGRSPA